MAITLEDILRLSTPKKVGILIGIIALILIFYIWQFFLPVYGQIQQKNQEISKLRIDLDAKKKVAQDLPKFQAQLEAVKKELERAKTQLPDKEEIPKLLTDISSLGKASGLTFKLFRPKPEVPKEFYAEIPVELQVLGNYHEVAHFFDEVGKLDRIVNISDVDMGKAVEDRGKMILTTSCQTTTFKFMEAPPVSAQKEDKKKKKPIKEKPKQNIES